MMIVLMTRVSALLALLLFVFAGPAAAKNATSGETGMASYYAQSLNGHRTASGQRLDNRAMVAAHRHLPFGSHVRVTNLRNGRTVVVKVVDRGPFTRGRVIDVSHAAAGALGFTGAGVTRVSLARLD